MVRNIVVLGGNSHPELVDEVCGILSIPPCDRILSKFEVGESRCEIKDSVRGKDVYIIQSGGGKSNDHFIELCIMISACKTGSAKRVTAVLPLFPYSRQPDLPYKKSGAPLSQAAGSSNKEYTFESVPATPAPGIPRTAGLTNGVDITHMLRDSSFTNGNAPASPRPAPPSEQFSGKNDANGVNGSRSGKPKAHNSSASTSSLVRSYTTHDYENPSFINHFQARPGYKQWVAQAGTLVANLLTCAGADGIITLELHDHQYQGFFDIPVDNLYGKPLLQRYIQTHVPNYKDAIIVSPDAGGAKRATAIADSLGMDFALIHKERRPTKISDNQNATMMLVGNVSGRICILVDDLCDTGNTITRAAKLLKKQGATYIYALVTHGLFSGDAIPRINASSIDKIVTTNSVPQAEHKALCPKMEILSVSPVFAEAIRRVHHGESISVLFQH
ncbi:hypothetical protein MCOR27_008159 [Pyricularia oryzae]|uniref:Ribose-phosphate pyrophosphokinase N-terminal domain-containing protein n=2 Tax=Pyricularia TaxID=48558 RepID=A0ABQ8NVE0_PYRGI|nr:ribose-phosphate pyrophosphokinase 5 [Pyricularia oryzae 70-15]KAH8842464.1 hypothetical protein MCOR01_006370 [Pyricularia oryzae]KAI6302143.1 hypothetical protein MCOR33_002460 [Pyricularia grisea]EHA56772.1 ribose-phosphate pyrophosphokinase 5 [Pyricularia oryzae 70-15]KAH9435707.1 hypothetical protein MCOR02_004627 [Pyricularia oryzae]KAI6258292.1 hypothetical protein MCOR19_005315 [Pyricularia oryzae]